ncbi:MAG: protein kinase [Polyangia bacterium]
MPDLFPRDFGRYSLLAPLAEGGMGALYLACQGERGLEKLCVIKTVLPQLADAEYVARFRDEAKVVVRLSHGNLVPVFDAGTVRVPPNDRDELYLAMEHVDGKDLRAVWNRCAHKGVAFPVDIAVYIARELARGLQHAHSAHDIRLVHRDVSPPNVLVSFAGEVKLTDFGLAASAIKKEKTAPGIIYGKVSYMSPEQARGEVLDGRTDLYAVGVILWELLTGRQLFPQAEANLIERVRDPVIEPPSRLTSRVPADLEVIVMRSLAPVRDDRYADCDAFRAALAGWLAKHAPTIDNDRVAGFLRQLFGDEIDRDRKARAALLEALHVDPRHSVDAAAKVALSATSPGVATVLRQPTSTDPGALIGTHLDGKYLVRRLIGEGGMGLVYEAEHVDIGRRVAIKILHSRYTREADVVARFRSEARAATRIGHPHIIDVFDSGTTVDGAVYLVMEFLDGRDLGWVIGDSSPLSATRAMSIARDICEALAAAHKASILHRDLKPENIFLVNTPGPPARVDFVKVLDFGIAKTLDAVTEKSKHQTTPGVAMGTPEYMAPEQAAGKDVDARADIYSVGAILYEMLSGAPPHEGDNVMEVLTKKATIVPASLLTIRPELPSALAELVERALAREPADRPESMRAMADELTGMLEGRDLAVNRRGGDRRNRGEGSIARTIAIAVAGAIVIAGGIVFWPNAHPRPVEPAPVTIVMPPVHVTPATVKVEAPTPVEAPAPVVPKPHVRSAVARPSEPKEPASLEAKHKLVEARQALAAGQYAHAEALFNQVRGMKLEMGAVTTGLAEVAFQRQNYDEAARIGKRATEAGGGWPAHMVLGNALFKLGRYDEAIAQYQAVLKLDRSNNEAKSNMKAATARKGG